MRNVPRDGLGRPTSGKSLLILGLVLVLTSFGFKLQKRTK